MKKLIAAWLLPLLLLAGCAPQAETSVVQPDDTGSPVYTDWSKLTPYEPQSPVYTYHAGYCGADRFQPRDDYGALLPYIGRYASMEQYVINTLPFYGLVTSSGELVSDPVYARINFFDDFLILTAVTLRASAAGTRIPAVHFPARLPPRMAVGRTR